MGDKRNPDNKSDQTKCQYDGFELAHEFEQMRGYEAAVEWVYRTSSDKVVDRKLVLPRVEPREDIHCNFLGIFWLPHNLDHASEDKSGQYICENSAIAQLLNICETDAAAYEVCRKVSAHRLSTNGEMLPALRTFTALHLMELIQKPESKRRTVTWLRNHYLLTSARLASHAFGIDLTRNDEKKGARESACDAVVEGLAKRGHNISARAVKELCVSSKKETVLLRQELDELTASIMHAVEHYEIARRLFLRSWMGVGLKKISPS